MPWAGGTYTRGYPSWTNDANANLPISATKFDTEDNDFAAGLNNCLTIDGLNKPNTALTWAQALSVLSLAVTGSGAPANGMYLPSAGLLGFTVANNTVGQVTSGGAWTFNGAVTANAVSGSLTVNSSTATNAALEFFNLNGANKARFGVEGTANATITGSLVNDLMAWTSGGNFIVSTNSGGGIALKVDAANGLSQCLDESGTLWDIGFRDMPAVVNSGALGLTLTHRGKFINQQTASTITIPANASVSFPVGTAIAIANFSAGSVSIAITTDTLILAGTATTGTRTIAPNGLCTLVKGGLTTWLASGSGVS